MSDHRLAVGYIRKLRSTEALEFRDHLLRLSKNCRRMRFAHAVSDCFIEDYAARMDDMGGIVYGYFEDGNLRAVAELRKLSECWGREAEAAFSVEQAFQERGIGSDLMERVIRAARNRGVNRLYMSCLADNQKMQSLAKKHEAALKLECGEVTGEIVPTGPNYFSILAEAIEDPVSYMLAVLDISAASSKLEKAA